MSREDVPESLVPIWHLWTRTGPTTDHLDRDGQNWPTVPAVCVHCQEPRERVPVAWLEGTAEGLPREVWPGRCNLAPREPADTAWVSMATDPAPMGPLGRGLIQAVGQALAWGAFVGYWVLLLDDRTNHPMSWVITAAAGGLGVGINEAARTKRAKRKKG